MTCTWTPSRQYSDYVETQMRGDGGTLQYMYHPARNGAKIIGDTIYIRTLQPEEFTLRAPDCTTFLVGEACNTQVALTKYNYVHKFCLDDCDWPEVVNDVGMMGVARAEATAFHTAILPLIYADMIANGTAVASGAADPSAAQMLAAINTCVLSINANGGSPGAIVLDLTNAGDFVAGAGAMFQPSNMLSLPLYGDGGPAGWFLGYPVFVTKTNLATAAATPVSVAALVWSIQGFAYASSGDAGGYLGMKVVPHPDDENGTNSIVAKLCAGYKTLEADLVYYVTQA